jgi:hypothetical protein
MVPLQNVFREAELRASVAGLFVGIGAWRWHILAGSWLGGETTLRPRNTAGSARKAARFRAVCLQW